MGRATGGLLTTIHREFVTSTGGVVTNTSYLQSLHPGPAVSVPASDINLQTKPSCCLRRLDRSFGQWTGYGAVDEGGAEPVEGREALGAESVDEGLAAAMSSGRPPGWPPSLPMSAGRPYCVLVGSLRGVLV